MLHSDLLQADRIRRQAVIIAPDRSDPVTWTRGKAEPEIVPQFIDKILQMIVFTTIHAAHIDAPSPEGEEQFPSAFPTSRLRSLLCHDVIG